MISVFYADVCPLSNDTFFDFAYKGLSDERKTKVDRLKFRKDKNLSVGSQLLLKYALKKAGYDFSHLIIKKEKNGKPYADGEDIYFSVSHSGNMVLCGVSDLPIGVDIQEMTDYNPDICKRFFKKSERKAIESIKEPEKKREMFFKIWTLKEAYAKMTGAGLGGFRDFEIVPGGESVKSANTPGCRLFEFELQGYAIGVATISEEVSPDIMAVDIVECASEKFA